MNDKRFIRTLPQIILLLGLLTVLVSCAPGATAMPPTETPQPEYTATATITSTATEVPTATSAPQIELLSPFADCKGPARIRANGAYNGSIPPAGFDSVMAPGGDGNNYQGHSDIARPAGCSSNYVYAPASGTLTDYANMGVRILVDNPNFKFAPNIGQDYLAALTAAINANPNLVLQIAHITELHTPGHVNAGEEIGKLIFAAGEPMVSYDVFTSKTPTTNWNDFNSVWSPTLLQWDTNPVCLMHCAMKLNNFYTP